jgi:cycloartenol synthase
LTLSLYLIKVTKNCPNYKRYYRERSKGSWTLSNGENGWPIADTLAECLKVFKFLTFFGPVRLPEAAAAL